jgi:hypothetical protein
MNSKGYELKWPGPNTVNFLEFSCGNMAAGTMAVTGVLPYRKAVCFGNLDSLFQLRFTLPCLTRAAYYVCSKVSGDHFVSIFKVKEFY